MVEFRSVKKASALKATDMVVADIAAMEHPESAANIGTDLGEGYASQINCKYVGGMTYIVPIGGGLPVKLTGYVSPQDCRAWYRASVGAEG